MVALIGEPATGIAVVNTRMAEHTNAAALAANNPE